jgi:protein TonB
MPEQPMRMVLEIPLVEQKQTIVPSCRQLNKPAPPKKTPLEKPLLKPVVKTVKQQVAKPEVKAAPQPEKKIIEKVAEVPEPLVVNPAVIVPEKAVEARTEPRTVLTEQTPQAALAEQLPVSTEVVSPVVKTLTKEAEKPAPTDSVASVSSMYLKLVNQRIEKNKRYPRFARNRGIEGDVLLQFVVARDGKLMNVRVMDSSGHAILDQEALKTVRRAAPFPKLPEGTLAGRVVLKVPISFGIVN